MKVLIIPTNNKYVNNYITIIKIDIYRIIYD